MSLTKILGAIKRQQDVDRDLIELEPEIDERDIPNGAQSREDAELERGGVLKATLEPGQGEAMPKLGDLVFLHYRYLDNNKEKVVESTRVECGGPGHPRPFILGPTGKSARPLRGVELGVANMRLRERCALQLKPEFAFLHKECTQQPPIGLKKGDSVRADVQVAAFYSGENNVRAAAGAPGVVVKTLQQGTGWEKPRAPFDATLRISARTVASDGAIQNGRQYFPVEGESNNTDFLEVECSLGTGALPQGLEAGVQELHRGETAVILCPLSAAVGGSKVSLPPPPVELLEGNPGDELFPYLRYVEFTVTLVDFLQVRDLTGDGGAVKRTLKKGDGDFPGDCPLEDTTVQITARLRKSGDAEWLPLPGTSDSQGFIAFDTGMGVVPPPVEAAVRLMLKNEVALVSSTWSHAYGDAVKGVENCEPPGEDLIPVGSDLEFEIELKDFVPAANLAVMSGEEKLAAGKKWREQGNALFKSGKYKLARQKYFKGIRCVDQIAHFDTEEEVKEAEATKVACFVNLAACAQKEEEYGEVIQWCDKAIKENEEHAKAYFRRAVARYNLGQEKLAEEDFEAVKRLDPLATGEVDRELARMAARSRAAEKKQRQEWGSFFK